MVPLCVACGEDIPASRPCPRCGAPPSDWRRDPDAERARGGSAFQQVTVFLVGLCCVAIAAGIGLTLWDERGRASGGQALGLSVAMLLFLALAGLTIGATVLGIFEQCWAHRDADGRHGAATTRRGLLLVASGGGPLPGRVVALQPHGLVGRDALDHYRPLRHALAASYRVDLNVARVDLGLFVALLSLVARRRVDLRVRRDLSWDRQGGAVARSERFDRAEVRFVPGDVGGRSEAPLERAWLDALAPPADRAPPRAADAPYRAAAAPTTAPDAPWVEVALVVEALGRRERDARRRLDAPPDPAALRSPDEVTGEFVATLDGLGDRRLVGTVLAHIGRGLDPRA